MQWVRFVKFVISGPDLRSFPFVSFGTMWLVYFYGISELRAIFFITPAMKLKMAA
jgi:hypothetical protein